MEIEIRKYPDPILRAKCQEVKNFTPEIKKLAEDMLYAMRQGGGVGLAASQIGVNRRIIVADIGQGPICLVNPQIIKKSTKYIKGEEGCLSLPALILKIKRAAWVEVKGYSPADGQLVEIKAKDILARVLQHEIDHLNGVLIIDRVPIWQRWVAIRRLKMDARVV